MTNKEISQLFRNIAASYSIKNEAKFRFQLLAYQKAADAIDGLTVQLSDLYKEGKLPSVPGIGPTLQMRLDELFKTGKVKHFEDVMKDIPEPVFVLMRVPSIGPKKAYKISEHFKLKNPDTAIADVAQLAKKNKIAGLEGFGEKSQADILRALEEYKEGKGKTTRMLLPYAADVADQVLEYLRDSSLVKEAQTLGSLRRSMPTVGDIDIAVATNKPKETLEYFVNYPRKERIIEKGTATSSLLVSGGHQVDLMVVAPNQFGSLLQHFTGSKNHNVHLRENALKNGLSLNEKGIKNLKTGKLAKYDSEEKFYSALGMQTPPPEMREDTGEIELALKHKLPEVIELSDIKGDFHIHSSFPLEPSHDLGRNSISEMLDKAKSLGYEYLGFSEHNPRTSRHTKQQIVDLVRARNEAIEEQNELHGVKTFRLMETDILPNGSLALPDEALDLLDATIVSIHSVFNTNKDDMTKRVLSGLSHPKAKILAHPRGRLLNERNGYDLDWEKIFEFCSKNNKALEINAFPNRLDLSGEVIRLAVEAHVRMTIDTDSHASYQMEMMRYGVSQARRGWATKSDIINALTYSQVLEWFKS